MVARIKIIIVFAVMLFIGAFSYGIHLYETKNSFSNRDSINYFRKLLISSKPIAYDDINFHGNQGSCELIIQTQGGGQIKMTLSRTPFMGSQSPHGILSSGDYQYQNDSLLHLLVAKLKIEN